MIHSLARLQFPLLYLPLVVLGLGVFGSDFDAPSGRIFITLFLALLVLDFTLGRRVERLAHGAAASWIALLAIPVAALAYRPVHLSYWDEQSTSQAAAYALLGVFSWAVSRIGAGRARPPSGAPPFAPAAALGVLGLSWLGAALYPLLPTLALGGVFAGLAVAVSGESAGSPPAAAERSARTGGLAAWGALLLGIDLFLVVWDYRWDSAWAPHLALAFAAAALGWVLARRFGAVLLGLGAANFLLAALVRPFVLEYSHSAIAGLALGALLARALGGSLGRWTVLWTVGLGLGLALYENLAFAGWRALLLLPPLFLVLTSYRAARVARQS